MKFSRKGYWSELPFPSPGDLPDPGVEPISLASPALASGFFTTSTTCVSWEKATICILFSLILSEMLLPAQSLPFYIWPWLNVFFSLLLKKDLQLWKSKKVIIKKVICMLFVDDREKMNEYKGMEKDLFCVVLQIFDGIAWWLRQWRVCLKCRRHRFDPWVRKEPFPRWRKWQPTPVFLPEEFYGQRSLVGYSPWGCKESDTTEWLTLLHYRYFAAETRCSFQWWIKRMELSPQRYIRLFGMTKAWLQLLCFLSLSSGCKSNVFGSTDEPLDCLETFMKPYHENKHHDRESSGG